MINVNGRNICENCFEATAAAKCPSCGYDPEKAAGDPSMLAPGSILLDKYIIGCVIGKGGFGITYLAYDRNKDKKVAIKEYFPYGIAHRSGGSAVVSVPTENNRETFELGAEKFYEEAQLISKFNGNPNIVEVYEFFYENDTVYLAMEYIHGRTLKEHIRDCGTISAAQTLYVARSVANALEAAHSASVLHRDISPDNIILCSSGEVKLIDFGAARQVIAERSQSFSVILKPGFAPIEQYNSKGNQGPWTDIYSLGATLYYALTGDIPDDPMLRFDDDDTFKTNRFDIAPDIWTVIVKATDMKPENRYQNAREMLEDLDKIEMKSEPLVVPPKKVTPPKTTENTVSPNYKQYVNFSAERKKGFFSGYKRVIIAVCAVIAVSAAIAIPVSLNRNKPDDISDAYAPQTDISDTSVSSASESAESVSARITDSDEDSASGKFIPEYISPTIYDYSSKVLYNTLTDDEKELYKLIYEGLEKVEIMIRPPANKYTLKQLKDVFQKVKFDNPQFGYVEEAVYLSDGNDPMDIADDETYAVGLSVKYTDSNNSEVERFLIKDMLGLCDLSGDKEESLRKLHDMATQYSNIMERDPAKYHGNSYKFLCNAEADDIGFALTFCYCAQALGLKGYVVDGTVNGEPHAWCRVQLDDTWYNVDIYADQLMSTTVSQLEINNGKRRRFRTFYLANDEFIKSCGYTPNEEYSFSFDGEYASDSPYFNYYDMDEENAFYNDPDEAYDYILEAAAKNYSEGTEKTSCFVPPFKADALYEKLNGQLLADLDAKYGVTPSELDIQYYPDEFVISMI